MVTQLRKLFSSLTPTQRVLVGIAAVGVLVGLWWLNHWNHERVFQPLFSGMNAEDAGAVVAKLKESAVEYRLSDNGTTILVPSARIAELRIQLASAGIPKSGRIGYELFDKNNFGITDFAEQVNYRRALEGELERSIAVLSGVEAVRVHITPAKDSVFTDSKEPAKASVLLTIKANAKFAPANVDAISNLISNAVQGLDPEHVSVVDGSGKLLPRTAKPNRPEETEAAEGTIVYRQKIEKDLLEKINSTLEPILGAKRFRTGVSVDCDFTSGEQSEETFDPAKAVIATTQKSDESGVSGAGGGQPGTASNLPRPATRMSERSGPITRKTENTTYQNSRIVRKTKLPQGTIRRISVAVLLDNNLRWEVEKGKPKRIVTPPSAEQIKSIRELISGAAGTDAKRGDSIVVESLAFDSTLAAEPPPELLAQGTTKPLDKNTNPTTDLFGIPKDRLMIMGGIAGAAVLALGVLLLLVLKRRKKKITAHLKSSLTDGHPAKDATKQLKGGPGHATQEVEDEDEEPDVIAARKAAIEAKQAKEVLGSIRLPEVSSKKSMVLAKHISETAKHSPETTAQIVRTWLNSEEG
jgi:flagellar M-ring protein FliF